jgi:uncharacterized coiled-coil DUF342 family protein
MSEAQALLAVSQRQDAPVLEQEQAAGRANLKTTEVGLKQEALRNQIAPLQDRLDELNKERRPLLAEVKPLKEELKQVNGEMKRLVRESDKAIATRYGEIRAAALANGSLAMQIGSKDWGKTV